MADSGTLGQLASLRSGYAFKSSSWKSEGFPVVKIKNVLDGVVSLQGCAYVGSDDAQKAADYLAREGDVLISLTGYVGQVGRVPQGAEVLVNQRVGLVTPHVSEDRSYVYHLLRLLKPQVEELGTGTAQSNVAPRDILELPIPHLSESQRRSVAVVLDEFDEKIRINTLISQNLEHFASKIFRSWFIDFDPVKAKMAGEEPFGMDAETAALFPDAMEESELGDIPSAWRVRKLGALALTLLGGTPSRKRESYWGGNVPWINSGKINDFRVTSPSEYITELGLEKSTTKLLPKGTCAIAITGATLGQFTRLEIESCANQSVVGVLESEAISNEFIYLLFAQQIDRLVSAQTGGAQQHINKNDVNDFLLVCPPEDVMAEFTRIVRPFFDTISVKVFENESLRALRDGLLPRLISGELEIPDEMLAA